MHAHEHVNPAFADRFHSTATTHRWDIEQIAAGRAISYDGDDGDGKNSDHNDRAAGVIRRC